MSKKLANEKEIEKARLDRKWKKIITLVSSLNVKNAGGALNSEEVELSCCFYLGEAELDHALEEHFNSTESHCTDIDPKMLKQAYSYLSAAATASRKSKEKHPHFYQDSHLLLAKYHFVVGEHKMCLECMHNIQLMPLEQSSKRGKYILAEALTCKALSLEEMDKGNPLSQKEILETYETAGEIALALCMEEDRSGTLKRSATPASSIHSLTPLLEACFLRPGELFTSTGLVEDAIQSYRMILRAVETKATFNLRKIVCRRLAELLLSFISISMYAPPSVTHAESLSKTASISMTTPTRNSPDVINSSTSLKSYKIGSMIGESSFSPSDQVEESVLLLLLSEAMLTKNVVVKETDDGKEDKKIVLNEINVTLDLLVFALSKHDQYNLLSHSLENVMSLAFDEFHLWYQFGLSLSASGKHSRALLIFKQCHKLCPENTDVLMLCAKICINHLQNYKDAIQYAESALVISSDSYRKAGARLAIGICYNHLAFNAKSSGEIQKLLKLSLNSLNKAYDLDSHDTEILFHLALNQALSKQIYMAIQTVHKSLDIDPTALSSLYLLVLLMSAQKRHDDALDILNTAIEEYPTEFGLQLLKVKLTEFVHGSQAALVVCRNLLLLWNDMCYTSTYLTSEVDGVTPNMAKSPSFSMSLPRQNLSDSKLLDTTASLKKVSLADGTSVQDEDTGSIAASIRFEMALSEATSGITSTSNYNISTVIALLAKLWLVTAECFINLGDITEATSCILEASAIFPLSPDVLYMRGRLNELQSNLREAKACYESALSLLPSHKSALQRLGLIYHDEGNYVIAEKTLRCSILIDSSNPTAWNDLGLILESSGYHNKAADCYMTSLELESSSPILPYNTIPRLFKLYDAS